MEQEEDDSCFGDLFQERILADDLFLFQSLTVQHYDKQRNRLVFKYRVGSGAVMTSFALVPLLPRNGFSSISQETTGTENCCDRATASNHTQTAAETDSQDDRNSARDVNDSPACDREILLSEFSRAHLLAVFSVGMCVLPWYWMGFATSSITISSAIAAAVGISAEDVAFWQTLYTNVLMEFMYVNKLAYPITLSVEEQTHNQLVSDGIDHLSATEGSKNRNGSVGDSQSQRQRINSCGGGNYNSMTATEEDKKKVFVPLGGTVIKYCSE